MDKFFEIIFTTSFAHSVLRVSTPIIFAGMAAVVAEKSGVPNIGIEGMMLSSALAGVLFSVWTGSAFVGLLGALLISIILAVVIAYFSLNLETNTILSGLSVNMLAKGGTIFILFMVTGEKGSSASLKSGTIPAVDIPLIKDIPIIGEILSGQNLLTYIAFVAVFVLSFILYKTRLGMRIRACGENPNAVKSVGISVRKIQYIALMISGVFAGFAGAFMSMGYVSWFSRDMTAGRGFIALAASSMGQVTPGGTLISSLIFGTADALSNSLQTLRVPAQFVQMIPYATTVLGIFIYSVSYARKIKRKKNAMLKNAS